ncbi:MAG TPA: fatty acid desaturase [Paraburkholderia sp.]|jgi:fatty acid desaturase
MNRTTSAQGAANDASSGGPRQGGRRSGGLREGIGVSTNLALIALVVLAAGIELAGMALLLRHTGTAALGLIVPIVLLTPTHWGLIHESIHGQLLPRRAANENLGRALSILLALPFDAVRFGHLMHHRFTREPYDQPDIHQAGERRWLARLRYLGMLCGGFYLVELLSPCIAFLPVPLVQRLASDTFNAAGEHGDEIRRRFVDFASSARRRKQTRLDFLAALALYGAAFALYGRWWPVLLLICYLRGAWISLADNMPHYGVEPDRPGRAHNFKLARGWRTVVMNHHLHCLHHLHPTLPWSALPRLAANADDAGAVVEGGGYFSALARQFRWPNQSSIDASIEASTSATSR